MVYEIFKLFIPYVILFIGFEIMKISDIVVSIWRKNSVTALVGLLGMILFLYSFFEIGRGPALYVQNIFENLNIVSRAGLTNEMIKIGAPVGIFCIIGGITLKLSDLYKKKCMKDMSSLTIRFSVLSTLGLL